jgi:hypothetical protein
LNHLKLLSVKITLMKEAAQRSDQEITRVAKYLQSQDVFSKYDSLTQNDFLLLAKRMKYKEYERDAYVYNLDESADHFYIVLSGEVREEMRNPQIESWDWAMNAFQSLISWKCNVFDEMAYKCLIDYRKT